MPIVRLAVHRFPPAQVPSVRLPPLMIVHGLFGSGRNWGAIARHLSADRLVLVPDLRNHADSPWADSHAYADMAGDLAALVEPLGACDMVGHSMGGKAVMTLALTRPDLVRRMVVADMAPVAYGHGSGNLDLIAAMRGLDATDSPSRAEADRRLAPRVADPAVRAFLLQSLDLKSVPPRWRLNLDVLEKAMPQIVGWPDTSARFDGSVLFLSGGASDYMQPGFRGAIKALFPNARFAKVPGAGHWLHAEKPREFERSVAAFLS